jgi:hypothetical protein
MELNDVKVCKDDSVVIAGWVKEAVAMYLDKENSAAICVEPRLLNPFLRCLEAMGQEAAIELRISFKNDPYYRVQRKETGYKGEANNSVDNREFTRQEMHALEMRARVLSYTAISECWKKAYSDLAEAANSVWILSPIK